jgi:hypothetical protein
LHLPGFIAYFNFVTFYNIISPLIKSIADAVAGGVTLFLQDEEPFKILDVPTGWVGS